LRVTFADQEWKVLKIDSRDLIYTFKLLLLLLVSFTILKMRWAYREVVIGLKQKISGKPFGNHKI